MSLLVLVWALAAAQLQPPGAPAGSQAPSQEPARLLSGRRLPVVPRDPDVIRGARPDGAAPQREVPETISFSKMDLDRNGSLTAAELALGFRKVNRHSSMSPARLRNATFAYVRSYLAFYDADRSGIVTREEVLAGVDRREKLLKAGGKAKKGGARRIFS